MNMHNQFEASAKVAYGFAFWISALKWVSVIVLGVMFMNHMDLWVSLIMRR
jgi:hypothetical protein